MKCATFKSYLMTVSHIAHDKNFKMRVVQSASGWLDLEPTNHFERVVCALYLWIEKMDLRV